VRFRQDSAGHWRLAQIPEVEGAFASVDPLDGGLVALTGGFDFFLSNYNRATQAKRQPGSSFKPFVYLTALERGLTPDTVRDDKPRAKGGAGARARISGRYARLREFALRAQGRKLNAVSIRITAGDGRGVVAATRASSFRRHRDSNNLLIALGAGGIAPLDLVTRDVCERRPPCRPPRHPTNRERRRRSGLRGEAGVRVRYRTAAACRSARRVRGRPRCHRARSRKPAGRRPHQPERRRAADHYAAERFLMTDL
jgi:hypothetical protein